VSSPGFGPYDILSTMTLEDANGKIVRQLPVEYRSSVIDVILQKTNMGASTVTLQLMDPTRYLVNNLVKQGATITVDGLKFTLVQFNKASDQLQLVFEAECVYRLRNQRGVLRYPTGTDVTGFMGKLVNALNYKQIGGKLIAIKPSDPNFVHFVAPDYATIWSKLTAGLTNTKIVPVALGRGTSVDLNEDSWTCMSRIASSVGWRLWEDNNTIYFGPDEWWNGNATPFKQPYINYVKTPLVHHKHPKQAEIQTLNEFTQNVQLIDFDWDVGKAYANATVTCMLNDFNYSIGEIVKVNNVGPATGHWMVAQMQRDAFNPQATLTLQVPMPFASVFEPTSLPVSGFPLRTVGVP